MALDHQIKHGLIPPMLPNSDKTNPPSYNHPVCNTSICCNNIFQTQLHRLWPENENAIEAHGRSWLVLTKSPPYSEYSIPAFNLRIYTLTLSLLFLSAIVLLLSPCPSKCNKNTMRSEPTTRRGEEQKKNYLSIRALERWIIIIINIEGADMSNKSSAER